MKTYLNEKIIAIMVLGGIAGIALFRMPDPVAIVTGIVGAIAGFVTAKAME